MRTFQEHRVEGILYVADFHKPLDVTLPGLGIPKVLVNCYDMFGTPAVVPDDEGGQYALTREVISKGHQRIAYLTLARGQEATNQRLAGHKKALAEAGLHFDPKLVQATDLFGSAGERQLIWDAPDKFFQATSADCDLVAMTAWPWQFTPFSERAEFRCQKRFRLLAGDDHRLITETLYPPLTTAELPYSAMGARAAQVLLTCCQTQPTKQPKRSVSAGR